MCAYLYSLCFVPPRFCLIILCYPWKNAKASEIFRNCVCTFYHRMHFGISQIDLPHLYDVEKRSLPCVTASMMLNSSRIFNSISALFSFSLYFTHVQCEHHPDYHVWDKLMTPNLPSNHHSENPPSTSCIY